ncbi:MAG: hypothetical protein ACKOWX_01480 [Flavobacteriales bacterium]
MGSIKLIISLVAVGVLHAACSQPDTSQCACLDQAQKVNRLSKKIWSASASHQDSLDFKATLEKKQNLCKKLQELAPEKLIEIQNACRH